LRYLAAFFLLVVAARAETPAEASFRRNLAGILERNCLRCHDQGKKISGLSIANRASVLAGGHRGPALVPGKPDESLLYVMIAGPKPLMPRQADPLAPDQVAAIRKWIADGAPWPEELALSYKQGSTWWSLADLTRPDVPKTQSKWVRTPVDEFILDSLNENRLTPSPEADRRTLIRRLSYDLHGLPPTAEEIESFAADKSVDAYEKLVDRLLASPRYGERWGRHWLDVVHYGESHGYDKDKPRLNAWPYRDYVIRSFNEDKPYARFVEEQLAGDVLFPDDPQGVVATGFIAAGPWDFVGQVELREGTTDKKITRLLDRDDMVMTAMSTFSSLTVHCARCHDHKFDPIAQEDYYSLQAVFAGVDRADRPYDTDPAVFRARRTLLARKRALTTEIQPLLDIAAETSNAEIQKTDAERKVLNEKMGALAPAPADAEPREQLKAEIEKLIAQRKAQVHAALEEKTRAGIDRLQPQLDDIESQLAALPNPQLVYAASNFFDRNQLFIPALQVRPVQLLARGSVDSPGKTVEPGAVSCVRGLDSRFKLDDASDEGARRAALARWIISPSNMLTWRSIVNRVWHYHFGAGIVDSPNDFGRMGSKPSHPELLDWLAVNFRDSGGSLKALHKLIVTSAVYRQSSAHNAEYAKADSGNRYLWRMNRQRLEAEEVHDSVLASTGQLDLAMGGPSVQQFFFKDDHSPVYDYTRFDVDSPASRRRSVYRFLVRSVSDPFMDSLDCPDASLLTPKRNTTLTALQALSLLNDPFMLRQSEHLAERVRQAETDFAKQIAMVYRLTLGRAPKPDEARLLGAYASQHGLENACRLVFNSNEFLFVD
jgi:hypothetical protein